MAFRPSPYPPPSGNSISGASGRRINTSSQAGPTTPRPADIPSLPPAAKTATTRNTVSVTKYSAGSQAELSLPLAQFGLPIPYFIGRQRIIAPYVMWYGGLDAIREQTKSKSSQTVTDENGDTVVTETTVITNNITGYKVSAQLGLGLGPGVKLLGAYTDNVKIWEGAIGPTRSSVTVSAYGMVSGEMIFNGGNFDQAPDPYLAGYISDLPAYVGISYVIFTSIYTDKINGQLSFEVSRIPNPLSLSTAVNQSGDDVNVASAMVDIITNKWGGAGIDMSRVDTASFIAAANLFKDEGNYCSLTVTTRTPAPQVLDVLQAQTNSIIYADPATNKIKIKPLRKSGYIPATAPRFNDFNVNLNNGFRAFNKNGWPSTVEEISGTYTSRDNNYDIASVKLLSVPYDAGGSRNKRTAILDYPTVYSEALAVELLKRDFAQASEPRFSATFDVSRVHSGRLPGDICVVNFPKYKLFNAPVYVTKVRKHPLNSDLITVDVNQLVMNDAAAVLAPPPIAYEPDLEPEPKAPLSINQEPTIQSAPFWMVRKQGLLEAYKDTTKAITAQAPLFTPTVGGEYQSSFVVEVNINSSGWEWVAYSPLVVRGLVDALNLFLGHGGTSNNKFPPYPTVGFLETPILATDGLDGSPIPSIISFASHLFHMSTDHTLTSDDMKAGTYLMFIGNEIFVYQEMEILSDDPFVGKRVEYKNVRRALLDTVPQDHTAGAAVKVLDNSLQQVMNEIPIQYNTPDTYQWRIGSRIQGTSHRGYAAPAETEFTWKPTYNRGGSPLRPHDTKINGVRSANPTIVSVGDSLTVTWRTRNRNKVKISYQTDPAENGEVVGGNYQVHRVFIIDGGGVERDCGVTSPSSHANSLVVTLPNMTLGNGWLYVRSEITIGGNTYVSQFKDRLPVTIVAPKARVVDHHVRTTETGDTREIQ